MASLLDVYDTWAAGIDAARWNAWGGGQITVVSEQLQLASTLAANYYGIDTEGKGAKNMTGGALQVKLVDAGDQGIASWEVYPCGVQIYGDGNNSLFFFIGHGDMNCYKKVAGVTTLLNSRSYNSTTHKYLRIRETGGVCFFEFSPDGVLWTVAASLSNPFAITSMSVSLLIGTWQVEASTTHATIDDVNISLFATAQLHDNFNDNSIDTLTRWNDPTGGQAVETSQQLQITTQTSANYWAIESKNRYNLNGSSFAAKIVDAGNQALTSVECIIYAAQDDNNKVYITINGNFITARKIIAGVNNAIGSSLAYVAATHQYLRIVEFSGTLYFDWSTDGITWTNFASLVNPFGSVQSVLLGLQHGNYSGEASTSTAKFDEVNNVPSSHTTDEVADNFNDNEVNTTLWDAFTTDLVITNEINTLLEITPPIGQTGVNYGGIKTDLRYNLEGKTIYVEVPQVTNQATTAECTFALEIDEFNRVLITQSAGLINFIRETLDQQDRTSIAYSATAHRWWRFRESSGTVYFETSPDGVTWTTRKSTGDTVPLSNIQVIIEAGTYESVTNPGKCQFDNFNITDVPRLTTEAASNIEGDSATGNGTVVSTGGLAVTERGVQYSTVPYADKIVTEISSNFGWGAFTEAITDLLFGNTYFYRSYAVNANGVAYGEWVAFTTLTNAYKVMISGVDRTADIINASITVEDVLNDQQNTATLALMNLSGNGIPDPDEEIIITLDNGDKIFAGYITRVDLSKKKSGQVLARISCVDYVWLMDRNLVNKGYTDMTDAEIINDIINTYCPGFGITTVNVTEGVTIDQINFNYVQPSQALRRIADLTGRNWYIDYDKDIHYFPLVQNVAPFNISSSNGQYIDLALSKDASQIKNRVYVRGGTKLSDATQYTVKGNGTTRKFVLPDKPHNVSVAVNGTPKTLGIKNVDTSGFQFYLNFQEKYIEQDLSETVLATTDTLTVTYSYDIPILVAVEEPTSIATHGQKEFAIFDKSITTQQAARDRASAELTDYANNLIEGGFRTYQNGFRSGQYLTINLSAYDINDQYIVQKVTAHSFGAGKYYYEISIASAKTMGIIRFLIELLEANKNLVEVSDDEVVDNLLAVTDSLNADSLVDNLTIDSAGPYATWCTDSLQASPSTRAIWDLFQWG